ncbi:MAG: hypothetical protein KJ663_06760 [Proteobacteria bacterium]|nr:hypothetical protein [Pseudomonadota bacterium]
MDITWQDEISSTATCPGIFYQDYQPGQERLFLEEKVAWNFPKWGEDGERITKERKRG